MITRRNLLTGMAAFIAAPAIIRVADLMPVRAYARSPEEIADELMKIVHEKLDAAMRDVMDDLYWNTGGRPSIPGLQSFIV